MSFVCCCCFRGVWDGDLLFFVLSFCVGYLGLESLETDLFRFGFVDVFHEDALVLELVTLALEVQDVVEVFVDFLRLSVLAEESAENSHASHPDDLGREASFTGTSALTDARVTAYTLKRFFV